MKKLSFMLVGAGGMGKSHVAGFQKLGCKLISVVDTDASRAQDVANEVGAVRWSTNYDAEIDKGDFDFVVIATWPDSHAALSIKALRADKHVICEKPIAHSLDDAKAMMEAAKHSNAQLFIGHCLRYEEPWKTIVEKFHQGILGKPLIMRMSGNQMTFGDIWRTQQNLINSTSPIIDCGVHYIDLMRWITQSEATEVYALGARTALELSEDRYNYAMLQVKFIDGSIGHYEAGWGPTMTKNAWYVKDFSGPKGSYSVIYDLQPDEPEQEPQNLKYTLRLQEIPKLNPEWRDVKISEEIIEMQPTKGSILTGEQEYFLNCLSESQDVYPLLEDAYKALEIVLAADQSIRTGKAIQLSDMSV